MYAIPDIDEPRTAVASGTPSSALVNTWVTDRATSVAGWPISIGDEHDLRIGQIRDEIASEPAAAQSRKRPATKSVSAITSQW